MPIGQLRYYFSFYGKAYKVSWILLVSIFLAYVRQHYYNNIKSLLK